MVPEAGSYEPFLDFVVQYLSQTPQSEDAYCFYIGMDTCEDKDIFMHSPTRDEIYRYRKNYHEERQLFKIKDKESELKKEMTKEKGEYYVKN